MTEQDRKTIESCFRSLSAAASKCEPNLGEALARVLQNPGSLIRPEIVLEISRAYGLSETHATDLAIGLEYFHTASLLFDDLPSMDDASSVAASPAFIFEFGDAGAILTALALINRAYALDVAGRRASVPDRQSRACLTLSGIWCGRLAEWPEYDLHYAMLPHDRQTTEQIAMGKTVSLIRLTLVLPAIMGGAPASEFADSGAYRTLLGVSVTRSLTILKDVIQNSDETGKTASRDLSLDRPNIALVIGIGEPSSALLV